LLRVAQIQEGDKPGEDPDELIQEVERVSDTLMGLIQRINATNSETSLDDGMTVSDGLATYHV